MVKQNNQFVCDECGASHNRWAGKCAKCGAWNCLSEKFNNLVALNSKGAKRSSGRELKFSDLGSTITQPDRIKTHISEFDRVCGGGLIDGMVALVGGDPGIGKSTLLLQVAGNISKKYKTAYISGEESIQQVQMRAKRLGIEKSEVLLAASTNMADILATFEAKNAAKVIIIDSIQTMYLDAIESPPGTTSQVRACAGELVRSAKANNICVIIVGHVTKTGEIAGPRILEHMVDTVLYFEGEKTHPYRILRSVKNRFGPTDEIGVFDMTERGLEQVDDPSSMFLSEHKEHIIGSAVFSGVEGTRPMLVEIQTLICPTNYATPKRSIVGWDANRLSMLLAVIETRAGLSLGDMDVYLSVTGGLKITEPAADMAVAAALISSLLSKPLPRQCVFFGEIGLNGKTRSTSQSELRLKEAQKLGFETAYIPKQNKKHNLTNLKNVLEITNCTELLSALQNINQ